MVNRYPHIAELMIKDRAFNQDKKGNISFLEKRYTLRGRFEPMARSDQLNYKAKFYTPLNDRSAFSLEGSFLIYERKRFSLVELFNYQTHCELWLI